MLLHTLKLILKNLSDRQITLDFERMYSRFVDFSCLIYKESKLEEEEPEYKRLVK